MALVNSSYQPAFPLMSCSAVQPRPAVWPPGRGKQTAGAEPLLEGDGASRIAREAGAPDKSSLERQRVLGDRGCSTTKRQKYRHWIRMPQIPHRPEEHSRELQQ